MTTPGWALKLIKYAKQNRLPYLNLSGYSHEPLVEFPYEILELQELTRLDLSENELTHIPKTITTLNNLRELFVRGNRLISPPQEVAEKGISEIYEYFRQINEQGEDFIYEAKLLILGEAGAGKTTFANKIKNPNYQLADEKSTEGVDVEIWPFPISNEEVFRVNIWDFGGQEIYHATHQFFLTKRSLYALIVDTRKEDTDFYYWLNVVELLTDNSPLLIIKNEKQDRHREINERQLRGEFTNLKEVFSANFSNNRGLDQILESIKHYVRGLEHIGSPLPKSWTRVRNKLEEDRANYISLDEFYKICKRNGFKNIKDSLQLSNYLHDLGVILHFQDDPLLNKTILLKPNWATNAVYKVLDNKDVIRGLGRFTRMDLDKIWKSAEFENVRDELLQLMMKFKLCYEIPSTKGKYIAPQLLSENQPEYEWESGTNLFLRYSYDFMPKGILTQFIVALHPFIWNQTVVWRSGVVLENEGARAEVIEYYNKREIRIRVSKTRKKELMAIVMYELDKIHAKYKRLKFHKLIPCNCPDCKNAKEPYFYRYETLQKFIDDRQSQIQCLQSYEMVNVLSLIGDIYISFITNRNLVDATFNKIEMSQIHPQMKELLKHLVQSVLTLIKGAREEVAKEITTYTENLIDEASRLAANQDWFPTNTHNLLQAVEKVSDGNDKTSKTSTLELIENVLELAAENRQHAQNEYDLAKKINPTNDSPVPSPQSNSTNSGNKFTVPLKTILMFPKYFGRFVFDLFGRHDSAETSSIILGWVLIFAVLLVIEGIVKPDIIVNFFIAIWRFFNPSNP